MAGTALNNVRVSSLYERFFFLIVRNTRRALEPTAEHTLVKRKVLLERAIYSPRSLVGKELRMPWQHE